MNHPAPRPAASHPASAGLGAAAFAPYDPEEEALFRLDVVKAQLGISPGTRFDVPPELREVFDRKEAARQERARLHVERLEAERLRREAALTAPVAKGPSRFTTDAAIAWGRRQNWSLVDRERYDALLKRHHDLQLNLDALMDAKDGLGLIGLQGAGLGERAEHRRKFDTAGGVAKARERRIRIAYLEFVRGEPLPRKVEWWA